jgi:4-oxalocrotonate tautomerase
MPNVIIDGPPIKDLEVKRNLVKEITDDMEKAYRIPRKAYIVIIKENIPENVGIGGKLIVDRERR